LIGYCGERSEKEGSEQVADWVREKGWEAEVVPISREFVHIDGLVVPLAPKLLVACLDALEDWVIDWLRERDFEFIDVGYVEAKNLGVNLVALGNNKVLSMKGSDKLNAAMHERGFEVFAPDMSMFTLGGGGVHCLCQALRRDEAR
jgi:N-dimethylarginine dimethylaminohydrolase